MAMSDAERQQRQRSRRRREREIAAVRSRMRDVAGEACSCCGQREAMFLTRVGDVVLCLYCEVPVRLGWLCPHHGISRRLG